MKTNRKQFGFTLIELMIVVAVIGILAAVALPQYKDYIAKSRVSSAISSIGGVKLAVAMCCMDSGTKTGCSSGAKGIPTWAPTNLLVTVVATDGEIVAKFHNSASVGSDLKGKTITFTPTLQDARLSWTVTTDVNAGPVSEAIVKNSEP